MIYGYARVSTRDQETHLQLDALASAGALEVRQEKASSVGARPELQRLLRDIRPCDTVIVYKLDRMARSLADLLNILEKIKQAGASIKSITEPIDTSGPYGLFMLQVLGAVASSSAPSFANDPSPGKLHLYNVVENLDAQKS